MKEIVEGIKIFLGAKVKDVYRLIKTEINIMLNENEQLDGIRVLAEELVLRLADPLSIAKINLVDKDEQILSSFTLTQQNDDTGTISRT